MSIVDERAALLRQLAPEHEALAQLIYFEAQHTNNNIAQIGQAQRQLFAELDDHSKRLAGHGAGVQRVEMRLDQVVDLLTGLSSGLSAVVARVAALEAHDAPTRLAALESRVDRLQRELDDLRREVQAESAQCDSCGKRIIGA